MTALPRLAAYLAWTLALMPAQMLALAARSRLAERIPLFYHRRVAPIIGLRIETRGTPSTARPTLFVCNHTSYLDISVLAALLPVSFIARHDMASWPLFGLLAKLQRSVFVERRGPRAAAQRDEIGERLAAGDNLVLFPEGTSNDGNRVLPFKSALFAVAERRVDGRPLTVQPLSLAYVRLGDLPLPRHLRPRVAWYGDMGLPGHLWRLISTGGVTAVVTFHEPVTIERFGSRKALAAHCHATVARGVSELVHGTAAAA